MENPLTFVKKKKQLEQKKTRPQFRLSEITIKRHFGFAFSEFEVAKKGLNALSRRETMNHSFWFTKTCA